MTHYRQAFWHHEFPDEPVVIYSEVSDSGLETRKIEVFRDDRMQYADGERSSGDTVLSEKPLPSIEEIEDQAEFSVAEIQQPEFERVWLQATRESE
jgi:Domain of unknown function (DUF6881)